MSPSASDPQSGGPPAPDSADLFQAAASVAKDSLDDQLAEVESIRQRSVQFLAFVGTATAFLVGTAAGGETTVRGSSFVLIGTAASMGMVALLLLFRSIVTGASHWYGGTPIMWNNRQDVTAYVEWLDEDSPPASKFYKNLCLVYFEQYRDNKPYLDMLRKRYVTFLTLSMVSLVAWGVLAWIFGGGS